MSRLTICAWIDTSSADTDSSAMIELRIARERAGDADALALAAGELVRIALGMLRQQSHLLQQFLHAPLDRLAVLDAGYGRRSARRC